LRINDDFKTLNGSATSSQPALEFLARHNGWLAGVSLLAVLGVWALVIDWGKPPTFLLPPPRAVWAKFLQVAGDGTLLFHVWVTLSEVLLGLLAGSLVAMALGYLLAKSRLLERVISRLIWWPARPSPSLRSRLCW